MAIEIKNLYKAFSDKIIFSDFSYYFPDTGLFIIEGDSGSGKTTLLRIISGIDKKYSGDVLNSQNFKVSFLFQEYRLFDSLTAIENITEISFGEAREEDIEKAKKLLHRLNFSEEDIELYPSELSGGMKQRVSFARAILKEAPVLILDEPTKELDPELCKTVSEIIHEESEKRLVLLVTHQKDSFLEYPHTTIKI